MKKSIIILSLATIALISCGESNSLKNDLQEGNNDERIYFSSYADPITKAENSNKDYTWTFYNHQNDFKVWAYKNPNSSATAQVFNGVVIDAKSDGTFDYHTETEARFWDKAATNYEFYAAAPSDGDWTFVSSQITSYETQNKGSFETTSTLTGVNLRSGTTDQANKVTALAQATSSFKGTADIDKLIAAPCSGTYKTFVEPNSNPVKHIVQLDFIHILSKMNVTVKKDNNTALNAKTVKLLSLEFFNIKNKGTFKEAKETADGTAKISRWEAQAKQQVESKDVTYKFENTDGVTLDNTDKIYFIESLVIPQTIATQSIDYDGTIIGSSDKVSATSEPYFIIKYSIDGEIFESYHNLATSFKTENDDFVFYEGYQNTLNINIKPERIDFTSDVADWDDNEKVTGIDLD